MASSATPIKDAKVGIVGSGLIGRSWAMLFAAAGYKVVMFDIEPKQVEGALGEVLVQLKNLQEKGLLRGTLSVEQQHARITGTNDLQECVKDTVYIQECVPERIEMKRKVWTEIDKYVTSEETIMASSTSSMPASTFTSELKHKAQCIVSHPTNPPFYCPLTEVCAAPYTLPVITDRTMAILKEIGQVPVKLKKELTGFVLNRMQYALLNECWRLIADDAISLEDLDKVMKDGLGMRYAFMGPMETIHLNAEGVIEYCEKYGEMIYDISSQMGATPKLDATSAAAKKVEAEITATVPLDKLDERRKWRDARLAALAKLKKDAQEK